LKWVSSAQVSPGEGPQFTEHPKYEGID
jgi:hypothetical protein